MNIQYKMTLGGDEFVITLDATDPKQVFEQVAFFSNLPKVGPNGETDLKLSYKKNSDGSEYYSVVSEKAGQEFRYGQKKVDGSLFPKGWEPLYGTQQSSDEDTKAPRKTLGSSRNTEAETEAPQDSEETAPQQKAAAPAPKAKVGNSDPKIAGLMAKYGTKATGTTDTSKLRR